MEEDSKFSNQSRPNPTYNPEAFNLSYPRGQRKSVCASQRETHYKQCRLQEKSHWQGLLLPNLGPLWFSLWREYPCPSLQALFPGPGDFLNQPEKGTHSKGPRKMGNKDPTVDDNSPTQATSWYHGPELIFLYDIRRDYLSPTILSKGMEWKS